MKKTIKLFIWLIILNVFMYAVLSEPSTERIVNNEYIDFTKNRLQNKTTKDTTEVIILASCGYEFFKNKNKFRNTIEKSNSRNQKSDSSVYDGSSYSFWVANYSIEPFIEIDKHTDSLNSSCCIVYKICSQRTIPALLKKINFQYFYSDSENTDYHIMFHNSQMEFKTITYIWLFGVWIPIKTDNKTRDYYKIE